MKFANAALCALALGVFSMAPAHGRYAVDDSPSAPHAAHAAAMLPEHEPVTGAESAARAEDDRLGIVWSVPVRRPEIALTFDDGPFPFYTPLLLHILDSAHVRATFFLVGRNVQEFPELVERIVASGDEIGNHTFNHYHLIGLDDAEVRFQVEEAARVLQPFTREPLTLFRPPHGKITPHIAEIVHDLGYRTIFWTDGVRDYKPMDPVLEAERIVAHATPGGIILLHNGETNTVEALPTIISELRAHGFEIVPVGQLLRDAQP